MIHKQIGGKKRQRNVESSLNYILRTRPEDTIEDRMFIKVMTTTTRADIENFNKYIKPKNFAHPYITGVLSFEENDTDENLKQKMMADFEEVLFCGIPPENRPPVLWVQHKDKGRLELNYTTFNALQDGRAFKTYYHKTDHHLFNAFCESVNFEHGFTSVLDKIENENLTRKPTDRPEKVKSKVEELQEEILAKIIIEEINNREELIEYIKSKGININRVRKNAVSIKFSPDDKPISLKGDIYEEGRDYRDYRKTPEPNRGRDPELAKKSLKEHRENFDRLFTSRSGRNAERFDRPPRKIKEDNIPGNTETNEIQNQISQYKNTNTNLDNVVGKSISDTSDNNNFKNEVILNEHNNRNNQTKSKDPRREKQERTRKIETIDLEQQRINQIAETVRSRQHRNRETIIRANNQLRFTRNHLDRFIQFFQKIIRPISTYTRKNEIRERFEERRREEAKRLKEQTKKQTSKIEIERPKYRWWYKKY